MTEPSPSNPQTTCLTEKKPLSPDSPEPLPPSPLLLWNKLIPDLLQMEEFTNPTEEIIKALETPGAKFLVKDLEDFSEEDLPT